MSLNIQGQKCVVCSAYLFEDDDIVYCPECGAPHHRNCYMAVGHCGMESAHGTENQYVKPEQQPESAKSNLATKSRPEQNNAGRKCRACGNTLENDSRFCDRCGFPTNGEASFNAFSPFSQMVEIKDDTKVAEDVTAAEATKIVRVNPFRYIPKFLSLNKNRKNSWNWAAFLLPNAWFAYRKMYKESIITSVLMIMTTVLNVPFQLALLQMPASGEAVNNYVELFEYYSSYLPNIGFLPIILGLISIVLSLATRVVCGIYGDWFYRKRVVYAAKQIRESEDTEQAERKYSGISFIGFTIAVCALEFVPAIITMFIV